MTEPSDPPVVSVAEISKVYPGPPSVTALQPCSFAIQRGESVAITGASGSGKTTLLSMLGLLDTASSGSYRLDGLDVAGLSDRQRSAVRARRIGFVFQAFHLVPYRSVLDNVELGLLYQGVARRERRQRASLVIDQVGLSHRRHALCSRLSGGEKQRVAIARTLVREPSLVLCDEPTGNLDTNTTAQVLSLLDDLHDRGLTVVVITHDPAIAARAERNLVISDGVLTEPPPIQHQPMRDQEPLGPVSPGRSQMRWQDSLREAAAAVAQRPIRTLLTALGTILGVGAFITTTGLAETTRAQVSARFDALAATEVRVQDAAPDGTNPFPTNPDPTLEALNGVNHAGLTYVVPDNGNIRPRNTATRPLGTPSQTIPVIAASPGAINASLPTLLTGGIYDTWHETRGEHVAVLGRVAANQLGITRVDHGPVVFLADTAYTVVGIVDDVARNPDLLLAVIIPTTAADEQFDTRGVERQIIVDTAPGAAQLVGRQAPLALRPQQTERLQALVPPDPRTLRNQVESDVQTLFYALSGLALLVGAIAITNATLLNIIERRPEIGLRRALGATRNHITRQIALEAAIIGTIAGTTGGTIGTIAVTATAISRHWTPTMQPILLLAAPALGIATGTIAGIIPALKASRTPPAETLRT